MMTNKLLSYLYALLLTVIIELIVGIILKVINRRDLLNIVLVNVLTNPILNIIIDYFLFAYGYKARLISLLVMEILIIILEGIIYKKVLVYNRINLFALSLILNLSSYFLGNMITIVFK